MPGSSLVNLLPALLLVLLSGASPTAPARAGGVCDQVAERGDDPSSLVRSLRAGETACFRSGTYGSTRKPIRVRVPRVTLMSKPGDRRARLVGRLMIAAAADGASVRRLKLNGRNTAGKASPLVKADNVVFRRNDVTNRNSAICFLIGGGDTYVEGAVIRANVIHDCGELPATNQHHGVYVAYAGETVIDHNLIFDNADRGIQLYPDADDSSITRNVIYGNGQGVNFSCDDDECSQRNVVERNVISHSAIRWNVYGHSQGSEPDGSNVLRQNCLWATAGEYAADGGVDLDSDFFSEADNLIASPMYVNRAARDLRLRPVSRCRAILIGG